MPAKLTFYPRQGLLETTATGLTVQAPISRDHTRVTAWDHLHELRPGRHTLWDYALEVPAGSAARNRVVTYLGTPGAAALEIHDFPGQYAQRFDGVDKGQPHSHPGPVLYIGTPSSGIYIHGRPTCSQPTCIVVLQHWDEIRLALARENNVSFAVFV